MINDNMNHLTLKGAKYKVILRPFPVTTGVNNNLLQDAVAEIEIAERDLRKVKQLFHGGIIASMKTIAAFIKSYGGEVTNYLPDDNLVGFNYGNISTMVHGEELEPADRSTYRGHVFKWGLTSDNYVELWDLHNICELKEQHPITWDCRLENACPRTCTFKHYNPSIEVYPTLQGFDILLYESRPQPHP